MKNKLIDSSTSRNWVAKRTKTDLIEIMGGSGYTVATMEHDALDAKECDDNAALIIRAVNLLAAHEAAAALAKEAVVWLMDDLCELGFDSKKEPWSSEGRIKAVAAMQALATLEKLKQEIQP